jgi:hypothetical protein
MGERDKPHSYQKSPQPRGRTTRSSSWETATAMRMAVESMEMALRAIPYPGRVPEQRLLSPKIGLRWWRRGGTFSGSILDYLGFLRRRNFIGGRAMSEGSRGAHTTRWCRQRGRRHPMLWLPRCPPPSLLWTPSS